MGQVSASSTVLIDAAPEAVLAAVADYQTVRPKILSAHYSDYRVLEGGQGAGHRRHLETAGHEVAGARRQGQRRRGRPHRHREGRELVDDHELDGRPGRARDRRSRSRRRGRARAASAASSRRRSRRWGCARSRPRCWTTSRSRSRAASWSAAAGCPGSPRCRGRRPRRTSAGPRASSSAPSRRGFSCCRIRPGSTGTGRG